MPGRNPGKGSKRIGRNPRTGKPILLDANDRGVLAWKRLAHEVLVPLAPPQPWDGPLGVTVDVYCERPAAHHVAGDRSRPVRPGAPEWAPRTYPDGDKVQRLVWDALTRAGWISDDVRICWWHGSKRYGEPRTEITLVLLESGEGD